MEALRGLRDVTEIRLAELLEDAMRQVGPKREVTVEIAGGALVPGTTGVAHGPVDYWRTIVELNPELSDSLVLLIIARNTGGLPASIDNLGRRMGEYQNATGADRNVTSAKVHREIVECIKGGGRCDLDVAIEVRVDGEHLGLGLPSARRLVENAILVHLWRSEVTCLNVDDMILEDS